ncbi:MAG: alpha-1,2-fucosyltransferase [Flavobacterium sp. BFFFF1]|uniref:alpha-1,2-fucosyltransferase n=1 Tax=Flavobacterium sp. BFFFF1 TaxID=2015557 RepID=UPI000BC55DFE|nr:alpha-1,2-fucosyltransferase [Flavobacterium sp. BFFFF1]OYU80793.1 MAG: alpha-1,2-fucosyltransferase [Flavobacterium sp. BFFFF1]
MIIVKLIGGLGNQMFQYAAAKSLALNQNKKLLVDRSAFETYKTHQYGLNHFNANVLFSSEENRFSRKIRSIFSKSLDYEETDFSYNKDFYSLKGNPTVLSGYFQSEQYFKNYEQEIRNDFVVTSPLKQITSNTILQMQQENAVSIHFRRGDYVGHGLHDTKNEAYYEKAVTLVESKIESPVFYVFSDDIAWAKEHFKANSKIVFVDFNDASSNFEDMVLMSKCKHNIIANSSFSWWGAWLNSNPDKIVTAPALWFNDQDIDSSDIVPEDWIKL